MNREKIEKLKRVKSTIGSAKFDQGWNAAIDAVLALGDDVNQSAAYWTICMGCGVQFHGNHTCEPKNLALLDGRER